MIDKSLVRQALRKVLLAAALPGSGLPTDPARYAWENKNFVPPGDGSTWIRETLIPIAEAQTSNDIIQFDGVFQYDVMTQQGSGSQVGDKIAAVIGQLFKPATSLTDPVKVHIMRSEPLQGSIDGSWWMTPVRIRILAYSQRG